MVRDGKEESFGVKVGKLSPRPAAREGREGHGPAVFGLHVQNLTPELAEQLGMEGTEGVVVTEVEADSPAEEAGNAPRRRDPRGGPQPVTDVGEFR